MPTTIDLDPYLDGKIENLVVSTDYKNGLAHSAAWRGVNYIADMVMKVPCLVYERNDQGGYTLDPQHQAHQIIHNDVNRYMSATTWKHLAIFQAVWWGNHVSWIERDENARPLALWPLDPAGVAIHYNVKNGDIRYLFTLNSQMFKVPQEDVIHIFGISADGIWGLDFISYIRKTLKLGLVTKEFATKFFGSGANASGILKFPPGISEEKIKEYLQKFKRAHESLDGSHKTLILFEGIEYEKLTIPNEASQFLETQDLNDRHIANFLKLPPSIVGVESSVAYASYEQHRQEVLDSGIDPWFIRIESEFRRKLLTEREKRSGSRKISFQREALKRVNYKDLIEGMVREVDSGMSTLNEARSRMDRESIPDELASKPRMSRAIGYIDSEDKAAEQAEKIAESAAKAPEPSKEEKKTRNRVRVLAQSSMRLETAQEAQSRMLVEQALMLGQQAGVIESMTKTIQSLHDKIAELSISLTNQEKPDQDSEDSPQEKKLILIGVD